MQSQPAAKCLLAALPALCFATAGLAQTNMGFETRATQAPDLPAYWQLRDGDRAAIDAGEAWQGLSSLRLSGETGGTARATMRMAAQGLGAQRIRVGAYIKTRGVDEGTAGLWLRIDGAQGRLYVDSLREHGAAGSADWAYYSFEAPILDASESIVLGLELRGRGTAWFDAVDVTPIDISARPPAAGSAARYLNYALDIIEDNSIQRSAIDWRVYRAQVADQARGAEVPADTHLALRYALGNLGDGHSYLMTPRQAENLSSAPVSNARTGRRLVPPRAESLSASVAYLRLPGVAGGTQAQQVAFAEQVQGLIAAQETGEQCGWIVDLRDNTGGNLWPMLAGIGPLLGDGDAGAAMHPDGSRKPFWYRDGRAGLGEYVQLRVAGQPYRTRLPQPPVAVLSGRATASSGEVILGAFLARPNAASFGSATRGLSTGNRTFPLSDGAALVLTVAATSDRNGRVLSGPIAPDFEIPETRQEHPLLAQAAVQAAMSWLERQPGCNDAAEPDAHTARSGVRRIVPTALNPF
jgi:C-terminal processing protease CtpA/Prc